MPGYLLAAAFHKQAFASATQHQLLAFLQARPSRIGRGAASRAWASRRSWGCHPALAASTATSTWRDASPRVGRACARSRTTRFGARRRAPGSSRCSSAVPPGRAGSVVAAGCGRGGRDRSSAGRDTSRARPRRSRGRRRRYSATRRGGSPRRGHRHELVAKARRSRGRGLAALRRRVRGARRVPGRARRPRRARVPAARAAVARASRRVPCGVAGAPRASFRLRPRPRRAPASNTPRVVGSSELAAVARARATLRAHRTQAEKLASAATGRAKRNQWVYDDAAGAWTSPYMGGARRPSPSRRARPRADRSSCSPTPPRRTARRRTRAAPLPRVARARRATPPRPAPGSGRVLRRVRRLGARLRRAQTARIIIVRAPRRGPAGGRFPRAGRGGGHLPPRGRGPPLRLRDLLRVSRRRRRQPAAVRAVSLVS